jgi:hypothetical protein
LAVAEALHGDAERLFCVLELAAADAFFLGQFFDVGCDRWPLAERAFEEAHGAQVAVSGWRPPVLRRCRGVLWVRAVGVKRLGLCCWCCDLVRCCGDGSWGGRWRAAPGFGFGLAPGWPGAPRGCELDTSNNPVLWNGTDGLAAPLLE